MAMDNTLGHMLSGLRFGFRLGRRSVFIISIAYCCNQVTRTFVLALITLNDNTNNYILYEPKTEKETLKTRDTKSVTFFCKFLPTTNIKFICTNKSIILVGLTLWLLKI